MNWIKNNFHTVHNNSLDKRKQIQFGVLIIALLSLIFIVSVYKEGFVFHQKQTIAIVGISIIFAFVLFFSKVFYPFLFIWLFIGNILGEISSFIILGVVYYLMVSPITFLLRLKDRKNDKSDIDWRDKKNSIDYEKLY